MRQTDNIYKFCQNINNMRYTRHFPSNNCLMSWNGSNLLKVFHDETLEHLGTEEIDSKISLDKINNLMLMYSEDYKE